jgi:hypothetical protein
MRRIATSHAFPSFGADWLPAAFAAGFRLIVPLDNPQNLIRGCQASPNLLSGIVQQKNKASSLRCGADLVL